MINQWVGEKVLVTGATGLVGSWLVRDLLAKGASVVALVMDFDPQSEFVRSGDYKKTAIVQGRVEDYETVERAINAHEVTTVFHLAAQAIVGVAQRSPLHTFESNIRGTYNVLEACRVHKALVKRVVVASSDKAYGASDQLPYVEDQPMLGRQPYEVSKSCADLIAQSYFYSYQLPVAIARCGNIYGGGDLNWSRIIPGTIRSCLKGESPVIRSDGTFLRDYIYVVDVTSAYVRLAEALEDKQIWGQAFNFSPEKAVRVKELVSIIQQLMGCQNLIPIVQSQAPGEIHSQYLDSSKAEKLLGWRPLFNLGEGLEATISWYRNYLDAEVGEAGDVLPLSGVKQ